MIHTNEQLNTSDYLLLKKIFIQAHYTLITLIKNNIQIKKI